MGAGRLCTPTRWKQPLLEAPMRLQRHYLAPTSARLPLESCQELRSLPFVMEDLIVTTRSTCLSGGHWPALPLQSDRLRLLAAVSVVLPRSRLIALAPSFWRNGPPHLRLKAQLRGFYIRAGLYLEEKLKRLEFPPRPEVSKRAVEATCPTSAAATTFASPGEMCAWRKSGNGTDPRAASLRSREAERCNRGRKPESSDVVCRIVPCAARMGWPPRSPFSRPRFPERSRSHSRSPP